MTYQSVEKSTPWSRRKFVSVVVAGASGLFAQPLQGMAASFPAIKAYRDPGCGCCEKWVEHLKAAGFAITMEDDADLAARKVTLGIPDDLRGCHTAIVGDYIIEGHVPADDIILFLAEKPEAIGLAVPGMPMGSPGMEMEGMKEAYDVVLFKKDGSRKTYASHA
jgi:hypothetical protein